MDIDITSADKVDGMENEIDAEEIDLNIDLDPMEIDDIMEDQKSMESAEIGRANAKAKQGDNVSDYSGAVNVPSVGKGSADHGM